MTTRTDPQSPVDHLHVAFDHLPLAVAVYTAEPWVIASAIVYVNEAFCRLSGYAAEDIVGHSALLLAGARPDRDAVRSILPPDGAETLQVTSQRQRPDGSTYVVFITVAPLRDAAGELTHFVAVGQEASRRADAAE